MRPPPTIPGDVLQSVRSIFSASNVAVSERLARNPFTYETALDMALIDALNVFSAPFYTQYSQSLVRVTTHFLGGGRHWEKWEIADIGFILEVYVYGALRFKKIASLQSKRLYAVDDVDDAGDVAKRFRWGFGGLQGSHNPLPAEPARAFLFTDASRYAALEIGGDQANRIEDYEGEYGIPIHYLLYNPTDMPLRVVVPSVGHLRTATTNPIGSRVLRSATLRKIAPGVPSYVDVNALAAPHSRAPWLAGWRLEDFVVDLCLGCHEGYLPGTAGDLGLEFLFNRRTGPIQAAVSVQIDVRGD